MPGLLDHFSNCGSQAKIKLVIVGTSASHVEAVMNQLRSLNLEHVSPTGLIRQEISRRTQLGQTAENAARRGQPLTDETIFALMRRWFWTRKPDAGFALTGFPATLLQAKVFDEWLDARGEALDGVINATEGETSATNADAQHVIEHYSTHGLLVSTTTETSAQTA